MCAYTCNIFFANFNYFVFYFKFSLPLVVRVCAGVYVGLGTAARGHRSLPKQRQQESMFWEDPNIPGIFLCMICQKTVKSRWHHSQTHFSRDHKCPMCDAIYSRVDTLKIHAKRVHNVNVARNLFSMYSNLFPAPLSSQLPTDLTTRRYT